MSGVRAFPFILAINGIIRSVEKEAGIDGLDHRAKGLLLLIAEGDASGSSLSVGDLVSERSFGSAPTLYKMLSQLETEGWITRRSDEEDARGRRVRLTARARRVLERMSHRAAEKLKSVAD